LSHSYSTFCSGYFGDGVLQTICPDWPQISTSQVAVIIGTRLQCLAFFFLSLAMQPMLPQILNLPASVSWVLGLQACLAPFFMVSQPTSG
jgi:hypothetical protein